MPLLEPITLYRTMVPYTKHCDRCGTAIEGTRTRSQPVWYVYPPHSAGPRYACSQACGDELLVVVGLERSK